MGEDKKWEKIREAGRASFVLRYGVLAWGVTTALLFTLIQALRQGADEVNVPLTLASSMLLFPLGGVLWGHFMWWFCERMRRRRLG